MQDSWYVTRMKGSFYFQQGCDHRLRTTDLGTVIWLEGGLRDFYWSFLSMSSHSTSLKFYVTLGWFCRDTRRYYKEAKECHTLGASFLMAQISYRKESRKNEDRTTSVQGALTSSNLLLAGLAFVSQSGSLG